MWPFDMLRANVEGQRSLSWQTPGEKGVRHHFHWNCCVGIEVDDCPKMMSDTFFFPYWRGPGRVGAMLPRGGRCYVRV
jgi:hypothetical protein